MSEILNELIECIVSNHGIGDKAKLAQIVYKQFKLTKDRSVYSRSEFAIRFSSAAGEHFSNTVLSLSNLHKVDNRPFLVCLVTSQKNYLYLANSTFLRKISHSSQKFRVDNIRGSFNGSDIVRKFENIDNNPENFAKLYNIHEVIGFEGNLERLVEATNNISPSGQKFNVDENARINIIAAPLRTCEFVKSPDMLELKRDLDEKVEKFKNEILVASLIENVNIRGRIIEYLIAGEDEQLRQNIIDALNKKQSLPPFKTENKLGDYCRNFGSFYTETDVKTKIMVLNSNPKAYNLDKMLEFLSLSNAVFMFYFVGIEPYKVVNTILLSLFQSKLLSSTILLKHWAGRNSRGVSQFDGKVIEQLILNPQVDIDVTKAQKFLEDVINL
ncbi:hypothetical protein [Candidatus Magnetaquicoccus inordinatus]|uniref:hypothetical protein n=1 Tax=Candidatus Magnetaquicoccus inordinatus TaxID=2496818 RepID=UPI00102BCB23|nr:hypothetical protein [Candidatus Magnetaquicoccus inordinatus]